MAPSRPVDPFLADQVGRRRMVGVEEVVVVTLEDVPRPVACDDPVHDNGVQVTVLIRDYLTYSVGVLLPSNHQAIGAKLGQHRDPIRYHV